ncbi:hypothetical protein [uncultured Brevundimonas sp.]|uniref:hypothetical protein n=1 Tax=uncultured Brevundimonas sp. TaxID=213418 RepID=UPI0025F6B832|nr:hypothetical protein [uncultured Brevundimonas sp.]
MSVKSKRFTDKWVAQLERDERAAISIARRAARIWPASKVAGAASRRDLLADEQIFHMLVQSVGAGYATKMGRGRRPLVPKGNKPVYLLKPDVENAEGELTRTIWTPDWTHTGDRLKLFAMGAALEGEVKTINITLSKEVIEAALKSPRGFSGYFSERMSRSLKAAGDSNPTYAFLVEGSPAHPLHVHGIIQSPIPNIREVLALVGGKANHLRAKERQVDTQRVWKLSGWLRYIAKASFVTADELARLRKMHTLPSVSDRLIGASASMRANGKQWYIINRSSDRPIKTDF